MSTCVVAMNKALMTVTRPATSPALMALADASRTRASLIAENALLRQQLIVVMRSTKVRGKITRLDRAILVALAAVAKNWRDVVLIVKPDTLLRWHRHGFKLLWSWKSRRPARHRPSAPSNETVALIKTMATNNRLWGAERIRGELLKLGIRVAKRTVQKYLRYARPPRPHGLRWSTFLRNHAHETWACDFVQTYDIFFRPIFAFFLIHLGTRRVVHLNVTRQPSARWTAQQLRNATPWYSGPCFLVRDRDDKFSAGFDAVAHACGTRILRTPVRAPKANAFCGRFIGSVRRECLDHVLILSEQQMRARVSEYVAYFNDSRSHQGIQQRVPNATAHSGDGKVIAMPVLGGLHHEYRRTA
jgi:putative transposase